MTSNKREQINVAFTKGNELMEWGDYLEALDRFLQVYEIDQSHEENLENLTYCYYCSGNESQLVKFASRLSSLRTGNPHGEYYLGRFFHEKGRNEDAIPHLLKAIEFSPNDAEMLTLVGRCYMYLNEFEKSLEYHNRAIETDATCAMAYYNRAKLHYEQSQLTDAITDLNFAVRYSRDKSQARKFLVHVYTVAGDNAKAIELANELLKDNSRDLTTLVNRAIVHACNDNMQAFEDDNQQCIQIATENIKNKRNLLKSHMWRAFALANLKKIEEATNDIRKVHQLDSNQARLLNERIKRQLDMDFL